MTCAPLAYSANPLIVPGAASGKPSPPRSGAKATDVTPAIATTAAAVQAATRRRRRARILARTPGQTQVVHHLGGRGVGPLFQHLSQLGHVHRSRPSGARFSSSRSLASARLAWLLTVPRLQPSASAISASDMSSK